MRSIDAPSVRSFCAITTGAVATRAFAFVTSRTRYTPNVESSATMIAA